MRSLRKGNHLFNMVWRGLAWQSRCDGEGGMEYKRVLRWWIQCGRPWPCKEFILWAANVMPEDWPDFLE